MDYLRRRATASRGDEDRGSARSYAGARWNPAPRGDCGPS